MASSSMIRSPGVFRCLMSLEKASGERLASHSEGLMLGLRGPRHKVDRLFSVGEGWWVISGEMTTVGIRLLEGEFCADRRRFEAAASLSRFILAFWSSEISGLGFEMVFSRAASLAARVWTLVELTCTDFEREVIFLIGLALTSGLEQLDDAEEGVWTLSTGFEMIGVGIREVRGLS